MVIPKLDLEKKCEDTLKSKHFMKSVILEIIPGIRPRCDFLNHPIKSTHLVTLKAQATVFDLISAQCA